MDCNDPWHDKNSFSSLIYETCPSCDIRNTEVYEELKKELIKTKKELIDHIETQPRLVDSVPYANMVNRNILEDKVNKLQTDLDILKSKLNILRRYHGGDGSVTREDVMKALGEDDGQTKD